MTKHSNSRKSSANQSNGRKQVEPNGHAAAGRGVPPLESLVSGPRSRWMESLAAVQFASEIVSAGPQLPEVRHDRVERLRAAVHKGSYRVSNEEIAEAMWADLFG